MSGNRLEEQFGAESLARVESVGAENIVELTRLAFTCEPCGFKSSTHEVLITKQDAIRMGHNPDDMLDDNAVFQSSPSELNYFSNLVSESMSNWITESHQARTRCALQGLGSNACRGSVVCNSVIRPLADEV